MFHVSMYGRFAGRLPSYADIDGYVPEPGDNPDEFCWGAGGSVFTEEEWEAWVKAATEERERCDEALRAWREGYCRGCVVQGLR